MYRVIYDFADGQDECRVYHAGDTFPRDGLEVTSERFAELKGTGNLIGRPLIEEVQDEKPRRKKR